MLQEPFEILGFYEELIFFRLEDQIIALKNKLTKEDMILRLKAEPEDVKSLRDEILVQASKMPLTHNQKTKLMREIS